MRCCCCCVVLHHSSPPLFFTLLFILSLFYLLLAFFPPMFSFHDCFSTEIPPFFFCLSRQQTVETETLAIFLHALVDTFPSSVFFSPSFLSFASFRCHLLLQPLPFSLPALKCLPPSPGFSFPFPPKILFVLIPLSTSWFSQIPSSSFVSLLLARLSSSELNPFLFSLYISLLFLP